MNMNTVITINTADNTVTVKGTTRHFSSRADAVRHAFATLTSYPPLTASIGYTTNTPPIDFHRAGSYHDGLTASDKL